MKVKAMRVTESGRHTWTRGMSQDAAEVAKRFERHGTVTKRGNRLTVTRFCGGKFRVELFS